MTDTKTPAPAPAPEGFSETARTIITAILIALVIRMFAFEPFNIPSSSMVPGLLVGDYLFVSKYSYGYSSLSTMMGLVPVHGRLFLTPPRRGDVVVFKLPSNNSTDYIKRVVGLPGDTIQMRHGVLYINGAPVRLEKLAQPIVENYVTPDDEAADYVETFPEGNAHIIRKEGEGRVLDDTELYTVPPHAYFMMGDNRDNSQDSRTTHVGFVPEENLVGRAEFLFFSLDDRAHFWELWKWPEAVRWDRLFKKIR
jgi:signal peptidase I